MAKKRRVPSKNKDRSGSPNFLLLGGLAGIFALAVVGLLLVNVLTPSEPIVPTPVLNEAVVSIESYCEEHPDRCLIAGEPSAPATLVEISDYGCSHCYNFNLDTAPVLRQNYLDTGRLRWIIFPYALNDGTVSSAESALCAREQSEELAFTYHERLFLLQTTRQAYTPAGFSSVAAQIPGLDVDRFDQCVADGRYRDVVSLNRQAARQLGISSTPTFFLNGSLIEGNRPIAEFTGAIDQIVGDS